MFLLELPAELLALNEQNQRNGVECKISRKEEKELKVYKLM